MIGLLIVLGAIALSAFAVVVDRRLREGSWWS